eukprot:CAMPEP_0202489846 /NCGR_PEP_ID=MMETSP1361-20130828/7438_1 /ASSEMBLY_ACC=CAM_ASM_000849 /TAXON_ID=210615 /ORGANISM="Staurosira complex sp., Strain CCMP2646" /LENGTH=590 /DNA_ID=CAMNT_0049119647 /DNA_START=31 /DNA_END=1803 /DNA_ORIENTATION=+
MRVGYVRSFAPRMARPAVQLIPRATFSTTTTTVLAAESKKDQSFQTWSFDGPCPTMAWTELVDAKLKMETSHEDADLVIVGVMAPPVEDEEDDDDDDTNKDMPLVTLTGTAKEIDESLDGALSNLIEENNKDFKNGSGAGSTTPTLRVMSGGKFKRYIVMGLGSIPKEDDEHDFKPDGFKIGAAIATKCNDEKKVATCAVTLPESFTSTASTLADVSSSLYSTLYADNRFRTGDKIKPAAPDLKRVGIVMESPPTEHAGQEALDKGKKLAKGIFMTKDIVNSPHNVLNSESLADTAQRIANESNGRLSCTILGKEECEARGMGGYLGVARGSETDPRFIHLVYTPPDSSDSVKKVGVIGKGLLFDTGGYNIKTQMMDLMKFDCGGAAAVFGAARATAELAPPGVEAHFIVAACENMISEKAMAPSDILTASNGKTIEVGNTDAEGRLTLADALVFADKELGCESIIELSTLTGACMVSLGKSIAGLWTSNDDLGDELLDASKVTGDKIWRMPLAAEYNEQLESKIADIKNIGGPYGGAITAALFLQHFVSKKKPFAHIDIAGPVWDDKIGATGFGAKLVTEWVRRQGESK